MDKLLVIGATGLLGSKTFQLAKDKYETYGTYSSNKQASLEHLNVANRVQVELLIKKIKPDFVIDTHALNNVDYCETHQEEAFRINVQGSINIAQACHLINAKYAFISSDYVFDGHKKIFTEVDKCTPLNYYGKTKCATEALLGALSIDYISARTSSIYGLGSSTGKKSFIPWLIENLKNGSPTKIISDLYYSPTYNVDIAESLFSLYQNNKSGIFHIVGKDCISKYSFAQYICEEFGYDTELLIPENFSKIGQKAKRPKKVKMSMNKLIKTISKQPSDVKTGLKKLHKEMEICEY